MKKNNAAQQLSDLLITRNFELNTLDSQGQPAPSADQAHLFSFDYKGQSGTDYGTVVIMLTDEKEMTVYSGDNTGRAMESDDKKEWFNFMEQLKQFAVGHLLSFSLQNLNKLKYSMSGQAALKEGLFEGWTGNRTTSWNAAATEARLMIKHKKTIGEGDARYRYIDSLFIETADGERFKLPFTKLSAGRAMLEHVRHGGKPYDLCGNHITSIVQEMNLLNRFRRANQGKIFEGETAQLVEDAIAYYETLNRNLKALGTKTGYKKYFESWNPAEIKDEDVIIEDLRHMFVEQNIDSRVEDALPLLAKLKKESSMKEVDVFESWTNLIIEGTWAVPDTPEKQNQLLSLLSDELPVGADATNATEQLYDLFGDDELFDQLQELASKDANADARTVILDRLEQLKDNPAVAQVIGKLTIEANPAEQPEQELKEFAPSPERDDDNGDVPSQIHQLANRWWNAADDQPRIENVLRSLGWSIHQVESEDDAVQLMNDDGTVYFISADEFDPDVFESCHVCHKAKPMCECSIYEEKDTVEKDTDGKVKSWKHEGDWEKVKKVNGKPVDPRGEVTHMSDKARRETEKLKESAGDVMFKDQERLDRLESLRSFAKAVGNTAKAEELDQQIKAIYAANPVGSQDKGHLEELSPDTLKSYVKKSSSDRAMRNFDQGVDSGSTFQDREPKFDWHNSRKDDQRRLGIHKALDRLEESGMSEVDMLLQDIARDSVDIYDIYANPKTQIEKFVSDQIHDRVEELGHDRPDLHHDDDIEKFLQIIHDDLCDEYGVDEGAIGKAVGTVAGMALAPEVPGSGMIGGMIGDKIGDKIANETVGGGNWLEEGELTIGDRVECPNGIVGEIIADEGDRWVVIDAYSEFDDDQLEFRKSDCKPLQQELDEGNMVYDPITKKMVTAKRARVKMGGGWRKTDPETGRVKDSSDPSEIGKHKDELEEGTALQGQYGHSGRMEPVKPQDADMMDRIKFLAGLTK